MDDNKHLMGEDTNLGEYPRVYRLFRLFDNMFVLGDVSAAWFFSQYDTD